MEQVAQDLAQALTHMQTALALMDRADRAHDAAAHLDLAVNRLSEFMKQHQFADRNAPLNGSLD